MTTSKARAQKKVEEVAKTWCSPAGRRALLVDDETIMLTIGGCMLEHLGFQVDLAADGGDALKCMETSRYDLVLTDLVMEGIDGVELACRVRNMSKKTKIIIMTGSKPDQVRDQMAVTRVDSWLFKPFGFSRLQETLAQIFPDDAGGQ